MITVRGRLQGMGLLEHDARSDLYDWLKREGPGTLTMMTDDLGLNMSTARYHVHKLEAEGLIGKRELVGADWYHLPGQEVPESLAWHESTFRVLEEVRSRPGIHLRALCKRVGLTGSSVTAHVERLLGAGLVVDERAGRRRRFYPCGESGGVGEGCRASETA